MYCHICNTNLSGYLANHIWYSHGNMTAEDYYLGFVWAEENGMLFIIMTEEDLMEDRNYNSIVRADNFSRSL